MPIKVQCACGKAFAAKDELAGKTVKCPGCQKPVKIPVGQPSAAQPKPAAAKQVSTKPAAAAAPKGAPKAPPGPSSGAELFDEVGLQAAAAGTQPCPGCSEPMPIQAVICIKCGYNTRIGRRMETVKERGEGGDGHEGHGAVAQDLLNRAAVVMDEDAAEEKKKTTEGMPWWGYLIILVLLVGFAIWMLFNWGIEKPKDEQTGFLTPRIQRADA
jgi:hypothetical protein